MTQSDNREESKEATNADFLYPVMPRAGDYRARHTGIDWVAWLAIP